MRGEIITSSFPPFVFSIPLNVKIKKGKELSEDPKAYERHGDGELKLWLRCFTYSWSLAIWDMKKVTIKSIKQGIWQPSSRGLNTETCFLSLAVLGHEGAHENTNSLSTQRESESPNNCSVKLPQVSGGMRVCVCVCAHRYSVVFDSL